MNGCRKLLVTKKETEFIITNVAHIRDQVDKINGRVRANERSISWIKGIGITVTFFITTITGYFMKE